MWLGHVPWAGRHWALPALTVLAPSSRYYQQQVAGTRRSPTGPGRWSCNCAHGEPAEPRWLPHRPLILVGDNGYAVLDLLHCCQSLREPVSLIARLRLDAALYAPAPPRPPGQKGRSALKGHRRPLPENPARPGRCRLDQRRGVLVRRHHPHRGAHFPNCRLVQLRQATRSHPLGAGPRPRRCLRPPSLALHRPIGDPDPDPGVVCLALATGGHPVSSTGQALSGRTHPSGHGDPAPVVGPGHCPHYAGSAGLFSWTTIAAHALQKHHPITQRTAAWYDPPEADRRPSWTLSPWRAGTSGWHRTISHCRPGNPRLCTKTRKIIRTG